jgi:hypothetical protein
MAASINDKRVARGASGNLEDDESFGIREVKISWAWTVLSPPIGGGVVRSGLEISSQL